MKCPNMPGVQIKIHSKVNFVTLGKINLIKVGKSILSKWWDADLPWSGCIQQVLHLLGNQFSSNSIYLSSRFLISMSIKKAATEWPIMPNEYLKWIQKQVDEIQPIKQLIQITWNPYSTDYGQQILQWVTIKRTDIANDLKTARVASA